MPYYVTTEDAEDIFTDSLDEPGLWQALQANGSNKQSLLRSGLVPGDVKTIDPQNIQRLPSKHVYVPEDGAVVVAWTSRQSALTLQRDLATWLHDFHCNFDQHGLPIPGTSALAKLHYNQRGRGLNTQVNSFVLHENEPQGHRIDCAFLHFTAIPNSNSSNTSTEQLVEIEAWAVGARPEFKPPWTSKRSVISARQVHFYELFTSVAGAVVPDE